MEIVEIWGGYIQNPCVSTESSPREFSRIWVPIMWPQSALSGVLLLPVLPLRVSPHHASHFAPAVARPLLYQSIGEPWLLRLTSTLHPAFLFVDLILTLHLQASEHEVPYPAREPLVAHQTRFSVSPCLTLPCFSDNRATQVSDYDSD